MHELSPAWQTAERQRCAEVGRTRFWAPGLSDGCDGACSCQRVPRTIFIWPDMLEQYITGHRGMTLTRTNVASRWSSPGLSIAAARIVSPSFRIRTLPHSSISAGSARRRMCGGMLSKRVQRALVILSDRPRSSGVLRRAGRRTHVSSIGMISIAPQSAKRESEAYILGRPAFL